MGGTSTAPMPKRVLIISDAWGGQINGVVRTYQNIIAGLEARNVDVRVIGPEDFRRMQRCHQ
jgi:CYTH domain-containing protein